MEQVEHNTTRNNITVGDTVVYMGGSSLYPRQNSLAKGLLKPGQGYVVSFVFAGDDFETIELEGPTEISDHAFIHDMFYKVSK
jgi:hypothetical protein